tara:strand:- start:2340 stop:4067 length:1728 start_codon:yes stop_codon:yes gene_type:complete
MANTGFEISQHVAQYFTTGPNSGSKVTSSFDVNLGLTPFSASLNGEEFFNRSYNPVTCEPGFEDCLVPLLTSLTTGSRRGRFTVNYVTQSSTNTPTRITASVSDDINFSSGRTEIFSASIGTLFPITSSFISGTVYFRAFTSCSGPTPSPNSDLLSFTYDLIPPLSKSTVEVVFTNTLSSPMEVEIRSERGNQNYIIEAKESITYDYTNNSFDPGAWVSTNKSSDLTVTIKGGSKSTYGNSIQRVTNGVIKETFTKEGGFNNPTSRRDTSANYNPDVGITFKIQQLVLPEGDTTTTTLSLVQNTPPPPPPAEPTPVYTPYPRAVVGSIPYETEEEACADSGVNFREKTYQKFKGYLYDNIEDALIDNKTTFEFLNNFILTTLTEYLEVTKEGKIIREGETCDLPQISIETSRGSYTDQESACRRKKIAGVNFNFKDNTLIGSRLTGRFPVFEGIGRGGRNIILENGKILAYETCGTELTDIQYSEIGFNNEIYPLETPELINPSQLRFVCNFSQRYINYSLGPSGIVYYGFNYKEGKYKYVPLGLGLRWYRTTDDKFIILNKGLVVNTIDNITFC